MSNFLKIILLISGAVLVTILPAKIIINLIGEGNAVVDPFLVAFVAGQACHFLISTASEYLVLDE